jgi:small subunit ribosomal protein S6
MQNLYETLLIVTPDADDDGINAVIGDLRATIEADGGTVLQAGVWEKRKLAYQVKGKNEGIYVLIYADGDNTLPAALKDRMKLDEAVIRSMVVRLDGLQESDIRQQIAEADHTEDSAAAEAQRAAAERRHEAEAAASAMSLEEIVAAEAAEAAEAEAGAVAAGGEEEAVAEGAEAGEDVAATGEAPGTDEAPATDDEPAPETDDVPAASGDDAAGHDEEKES